MFKRKIYDKLKEWKEDSDGKTALMIEGARRVGKSTVAKEFAEKEYESYILIDFSNCAQNIKDLFEHTADLNFFFLQLQLLSGIDLVLRKSLIIFDEVQLYPQARQAIKHLVNDGRYDYLETGSLISIRKNVKDILIPSEEQKINMFPMDYEEFLWALGNNSTMNLTKKVFESKKPIGESANRKLMRDFRLYMLVGGMPQAVNEYITTNNFKKVDLIKRNILSLYIEDFEKLDNTGRAKNMFAAIPAQLSSNSSRYKVSTVVAGERAANVLGLIEEMKASKTVLLAYNANDPNAGMALNKDTGKFKMFLADTGLFVTLAFMDKDFTDNIIYEKLLNDKLPVNLGYIYENVVAQMLTAKGNELFYHTFPKETSNGNYEIDFLLSKGNKIVPIEVKSSGYKTHKSLDAFSKKYSSRIAEKYLVYSKDYSKEKDLEMIPLYMVPFL